MSAQTGADGEHLLVRAEGGRLFDALTLRPVTLEELADEVRSGRRFRVRGAESGVDCTYQVLAQVLLTALAPTPPGTARAAGRSSGIVELLCDAVGAASCAGRGG